MTEYPIWAGEGNRSISKLECKRLLYLAYMRGGSKTLYHRYYYLIGSLICWTLGTAFLTPDGLKELRRLCNE